MFIPEGYALSNEIANKAKISISNFSMFRKLSEDNNHPEDVLKFGNCTFIKTNSYALPNYIRKALSLGYTDCSGLALVSYLRSEYNIKDSEIMTAFKEYNPQIVKIAGKKFLKLDEAFVKQLKGKITTNLTKADAMECMRDGDIEGYLKISKDNYLVWYRVL